MSAIPAILLWLYVAAATAYWLFAAWAMWRMGASRTRLADATPAQPDEWPK